MKKFSIITLSLSLILLIGSGLLIWLESRYSSLHLPRMIIGSIVVLMVPGYWITRWTFPQTGEEKFVDRIDEKAPGNLEAENMQTIDGLERFVLSVALSISAVPLILFYVNFLGVPLTVWSVYWTIVGVSVASMIATIFIERRHAHLQQ
jgi:uncharacterized membrane protein